MLVLLYTVVGIVLGWLRPLWGLAALVGGIAVTASLWWQIGLENSPAPLAYILALLLGWAARRTLPGRAPAADGSAAQLRGGLLLAAFLTVTFSALATLLAVLREHAASPRLLWQQLTSPASLPFTLTPATLPGELQAALTVITGPLLLIASLELMRGAGARAMMRRAFTCGAIIALAAPVVQFLLLDPWVRPDKGEAFSTGLVGFFQDPHGYAAYLLLGIGFAGGTALGSAAAGRRRAAIGYGLLGITAVGVLVGTNSKSGLAVLVVVGLCLVTMYQLERRRARGGDLARGLLLPAGIIAVALTFTLALLLSSGVRNRTYTMLREVGARRIAQPLGPDVDWQLLLGDRPARWSATAAVIEQRPLWGAGPLSIRTIPLGTATGPGSGELRTIVPENTHNYYLQLAAEYGIPALLAMFWLVGTMLSAMWSNLAHHPSVATRGMIGGILSGVFGFLLFGIVSHPMLLPECQAVFWTLAALAISSDGHRSSDALLVEGQANGYPLPDMRPVETHSTPS